jgi:hypothetical protein
MISDNEYCQKFIRFRRNGSVALDDAYLFWGIWAMSASPSHKARNEAIEKWEISDE